MSDLERKNEQLMADAKVDVLTSLLNRCGFLPLIEALMDEEYSERFCVAFFGYKGIPLLV